MGRLALAGTGVLAVCGSRAAQPLPGSAKVGVLATPALDPSPDGTAFRAALRELDYVEGWDRASTFRWAGLPETLASEAPGLIGRGADVTMTSEDVATRAARDVSETVPIVMADSSDPVRAGLIAGLFRPGGNVTGLMSLTG